MGNKWLMCSMVITVLAVSLFYYVKPSLSRSFHQKYTDSTNLRKENINGLFLYENIYDKDFKDGSFLEKSTYAHEQYYKLQEGLEVAVNSKGYILGIIAREPNVKTAKGIHAGDSIAKLKKIYGDQYYRRMEQGATIIGYVDHKNHQSIEFWFYKKKVTEMRFEDNSN